ncbi:MAG: HU family DNA-binding protein [Ruminococcus sp.]
MNRKEFVEEIAKKKGISKLQAYRSVNAIMDTIRLVLMQGEKIEIGRLCSFGIVTDLNGDRISVFKAGRGLKQVLNTSVSKEDLRQEKLDE